MYNRYVPAEDGTFRRQSLPDCAPPAREVPAEPRPKQSVGSFFGNLLPRDFETEDMIVVLLLLFISADCKETPNTALITLLIYLFL